MPLSPAPRNLVGISSQSLPHLDSKPQPKSFTAFLPDDKVTLRCGWISVFLFGLFFIVLLSLHLLPVQAFDTRISTQLCNIGGANATGVAAQFAWLGSKGLYVAIPLIAYLFWRTGRGAGLKTFAIILLGHFCLLGTKTLVARPRPDSLSPLAHLDSFPSGHTLIAVVLMGSILISLLPRCQYAWQRFGLWGAAVAWPLLMGLSRIQMGRHYVGDVMASWLVGTAWMLLCAAAIRWKSHVSPVTLS